MPKTTTSVRSRSASKGVRGNKTANKVTRAQSSRAAYGSRTRPQITRSIEEDSETN